MSSTSRMPLAIVPVLLARVVLVAVVIAIGAGLLVDARVAAAGSLVWTARSPMPIHLHQGASAIAGNGRIYVFGGAYTLRITQEYDPLNDTWTRVADMPTGRYDLGGAAGPDGKAYAITGWQMPGFSSAMEAYDPATGAWTSRAPVLRPRQIPACATGKDGFIYCIGGTYYEPYDGLNLVDVYNSVANNWTTAADMPTARWWLAAVGASNGKIYAIGGYLGGGGSLGNGQYSAARILNTVEEYDPGTNTWTTKAPMPTPRAGLTAVATPDGKIYAIGGNNGQNLVNYLATVEVYDTATNTWSTETPMNGSQFLPFGAFIDGVIYVVGGFRDGAATTAVQATRVVAAANTTPPSLTLPSDITMATTSLSGAIVAYSASALDDVNGTVPVTCVPASGSTFPIGATTVICSASDNAGNTATASFHVTVLLLQGVVGVTGATGPQGIQGDPGPAGLPGVTGATGATGPAGATGAAGATGPAGPAGPAGATAPTGATGPAAPPGPA